MTSPVSAIEAIEKAPNRIQGMVRSIEQYRNGDPKAVAAGSHAQVLFALQDMRHDILVLWDFAVEAARQAEALQRENAEKDARIAALEEALRPFAAIEPVSISTSDGHIASAAFRRARALLGGKNAE